MRALESLSFEGVGAIHSWRQCGQLLHKASTYAFAKISSQGAVQWINLLPQLIATSFVLATDTNSGDFYAVIINYQSAARWRGVTIPTGVSMLKLDCEGRGLWSRSVPNLANGTGSIVVDHNRLYYCGIFKNTIVLNPGVSYSTGADNRGGSYLMCLDTSGRYRWSRAVLSAYQPPSTLRNDVGIGYMYKLPGLEQYQVMFYADRDFRAGNVALPNDSIGLLRFDSAGTFIKAIPFAAQSLSLRLNGNVLADTGGNLLLNGTTGPDPTYVADTVFTSADLINPTGTVNPNGYLVMLDSAGKRRYAVQVASRGTTTINSIDLDARGNALINFIWNSDSGASIRGRALRRSNSVEFGSSPVLMTVAPTGRITALYDSVSQSYGGFNAFWLGPNTLAGTLRLLPSSSTYFAGGRLQPVVNFCVLGPLKCPRPTPVRLTYAHPATTLFLPGLEGCVSVRYTRNGQALSADTLPSLVFQIPRDTGFYQVRLSLAAGCDTLTNIVHVTDTGAIYVAVQPKAEAPVLKAWPNPCAGQLTIQPAEAGELLLFDAQGRLLRKVQGQTGVITQMDLNSLPPGLYVLRQGRQKFTLIRL